MVPTMTPVTNLARITYSTAAAGLAGVCVLHMAAITAATRRGDARGTKTNALGAAVCAIATLHYMWMRDQASRGASATATRFSDWYVTTGLMLFEFFLLANALETKTGVAWGDSTAATGAAATFTNGSSTFTRRFSRQVSPYLVITPSSPREPMRGEPMLLVTAVDSGDGLCSRPNCAHGGDASYTLVQPVGL